ncbi:MAG: UvrD-helicase domain-containing protein [bacterium]|nr:UvrD-helicase domain-containing protein [bacterium]
MEYILNKEQKEAVEHGDGPLLIIAGAGTGKTTVVTSRIQNLILKKKVLPSEILALTFTDKAAREMEERVDKAMPYGYTQMWILTFHAFCDRILRNEAIHIGLNPSYKLVTEAEAILFLRQNIFKFGLRYFLPLGNPNKFLSGLLQHFSRLKDEDVSPNEYLRFAQTQSKKLNAKRYTLDADLDEIKKTLELANAFKTYEELKIKEGMMDFSDLISNTLKLFRTRKNVLTNYQNQFKYILVDEFQDTNFAQNTLAILLAGSKKNITVVGDDDQAIYRWRGAAISNIIQFRKTYPKTKIITLIKNYRSTEEILNKSYALIQNNNPDRLEVKENIDKKLRSMRDKKGNHVELLFADRVENEAEQVVEKIKELIRSDKRSYKDFAILVRANDHSQPFQRAFLRHNIPYQFLGPGRLFHQEEIKDLISYLKVLYNFEDSTSFYRVLTMPIFELDARDIAALLNFGRRKNLSLFIAIETIVNKNEEIFLKQEMQEKLKTIYEMIVGHLKKVPKDTAGQILYYFLQDSGMLKSILSKKTDIDEKKSQNIARFFDKLKTYESQHDDASVFAVVDWIELSMQLGESPLAQDTDWTQNDAVNILTIHSSKGLEFPVVFLVNLVSQRFPTRERSEQIPIPQELIKEILPEGDYHLQEERRLFYVGMTRARDNLFLTAANFYGEGKRERKISPFVYETLGKDAVEKFTLEQSNNRAIQQLNLIEWSEVKPSSQLPASPQGGSTLNSQFSIPITYLSYSQIQTFNICPLHYKLKYILRVPTPPSSAQSFGTSVHSTLRNLYQMGASDVETILKNFWISEGYDSKIHEEEAFKKAKRIIANYLKENFNPKITIGLELSFKFSLKGIKVAGRIDRVDKLDEKKIEIVDYKTGDNVPDEKKLANDLQLTFYALAAMEVKDNIFNKDPKDVLLSLYFLEKGQKFTTTRTREQLEEAKEEILKKAEEIEKSDFSCSGISLCAKCEYKILCSAN